MSRTVVARGPWAGSGTHEDPFRPRLADEYALEAWEDISRTPGGVGVVVVRATLPEAELARLEADPTYQTSAA